ncbi:hypothetical protein [Microscilla marina]|uniref:Uncharacterized protein n=1 Tax=Microscilla marina ATCC 23134 TaxID=313606 RepID=A1ZZL2_MICM2|nr:hypothetical protein [Microscilla marina]EAY24166.1 hypothetical protein M23134_00897 [Microscilla marina ATCC 23134]
MLPQQYTPTVKDLVNLEFVPSDLHFVKEAFEQVLSKLYYNNFRRHTSADGTSTTYSLDVYYYKELQVFNIPSLNWEVALNPPDPQSALGGAKFGVHLFFRWGLLQHVPFPAIETFDFSPKSFLLLLINILGIDYDRLIEQVAENFHPSPTVTSLDAFVSHYNNTYAANITHYTQVRDVVNQIRFERDIIEVIVDTYLHSTDDLATLFKTIATDISGDDIKAILTPELHFSINDLSLGFKLPRKIFKPVDARGQIIPDPVQSALIFRAGSLHYSNQAGLVFEKSASVDFQKSAILNTGIVVEINKIKLDLSEQTNLPEAAQEGRLEAFRGFYAETATITLPTKWFKQVDQSQTKITARHLLVGTGGLSGTISLEAVNPNSNVTPILATKIGADNGFEVGFQAFGLTFQQNVVTASNIAGQLKIPRLKNSQGQEAVIDISGHLDAEGDFLLTASNQGGFEALSLPGVLALNITSLELGRQDDKFFIGIGCKLRFTNQVMDKMLKGQSIEVSGMRIYSDGSFEIVGGTIPVPASFSLNLGPLEVGISGINFGSYQREHLGVMRKYYVFGFDGALGLGPIGVEARGKGMQYFFTIDNDPAHGKPAHDYFSIQTIEVDITIPGNATPESATAIIQGYLSIPQPGESLEYEGGVSVKLPKARISGSADMRLAPQYPAFLIDAQIGLPKPIPLGATGLGFYGFKGLLGYRYVAEKEAIGLESGKDSWYDYMAHPRSGIQPEKFSGPDKTADYAFPFSVGAGATLATMDDGFLLSTRLFLLLSLPSVFILEGKANVLSQRLDLDSSNEPPFFAFLAIGDRSIEMGLGADYQLPKSNGNIIDLYAEVQAGFFFDHPSAWYIHFGTKEKPISARLFSLLDVRAFLMLSAKGIAVGARAEFNFDKRFGPAHVKAWLYAEVGAKLSFERPQLGGHIAVGGGLEVSLWFISLGLSFDAILAAEAAKPFLVYAQFRVCGKIKIAFIKIKKCVNVELKWEKDKQVDRSPIAPLLPERAHELVKGVHMLTGETFDLQKFNALPSAANITGSVLPLDTYIDLKFTKAVLPNAVAHKIGGVNHPPAGYTDLIPPDKTIKGGKEVRQVKHRYSIESIDINIWNGNAWQTYHPYEAMTNHANTTAGLSQLKIGHWQKSDQQYNAIRLLASAPFSYTEQGEPGWFVPEQMGITAASMFCEGVARTQGVINWLTTPLNTLYATNMRGYYQQQGIYYKLTGHAFSDLQGKTWGMRARVASDTNTPAFAQSLQFDNSNDLELKLPEAAQTVILNLSTEARGVTIQYYGAVQTDTVPGVRYSLVAQEYKTKAALANPVTYSHPTQGVSKILIVPDKIDQVAVMAVRKKLAELYFDAYVASLSTGLPELNGFGFVSQFNLLTGQLETLYEAGGTMLPNHTPVETLDFFLNQYEKAAHTYHHQIETPEGDIYAVGEVLHASGKQVGLITKLNARGEVIWEKSYAPSSGTDFSFRQVVLCDNGDLMLLVHHLVALRRSVLFTLFGLFRVQSNGTPRDTQATFYDYFPDDNHDSFLVKMNNDQFFLAGGHTALRTGEASAGGGGGRRAIGDLSGFNKLFVGNVLKGAAFDGQHLLLVGYSFNSFAVKLDENFQLIEQQFWGGASDSFALLRHVCYSEGQFVVAGDLASELKPRRHGGDPLVPLGNVARFVAQFDASASLPQELAAKVFNEVDLVDPLSYALKCSPQFVFVGVNERIYKFDRQLNLAGNYIFGEEAETVHLDGATAQSVLLHSYAHAEEHYLARLDLGAGSCRSKTGPALSLIDVNIAGSFPGRLFAGEQWRVMHTSNLTVGEVVSAPKPLCSFTGRKPTPEFSFKSYLHEVNWQSVEDYVLNQHIPGQTAIQEDYQASVNALNKTVRPVWRPNSTYYIHFKLRDNVDDGQQTADFEYYYGFKTAGPVGHFHNAAGVHYGASRDGQGHLVNPEKYALANMRKYIDYTRSYPNADGNLLRSKPLFYSSENGHNTIALFFTQAYTAHLMNEWPAYQGLASLQGRLQIVVKDPTEGLSVENPPPPHITTTEIPQAVVSWEVDNAPPMPTHLQQLNNFVQAQANNPDLQCLLVGGELIKPLSYVTKVTLTHLKPQKMYTAIVNNVFEGATAEVHNFVFQTSRYAHFAEQVNSHRLQDDQGNAQNAVFTVPLTLDAAAINTAYHIVANISDPASAALATQWNDLFARAIEGALGMPPMAPALTTEFHPIKDTNSGQVVALLIRNPEPLNDPKMPLAEAQPTIAVMQGSQVATDYRVLLSQDYAQALIMHSSKAITASSLVVRFQYKKWNGNDYEVVETIQTNQLIIQ